jgi:hypothetical protein
MWGTTNSKPFSPIIIGPSSVSEMGQKVKKQVIKTHDEESSTQLGNFT